MAGASFLALFCLIAAWADAFASAIAEGAVAPPERGDGVAITWFVVLALLVFAAGVARLTDRSGRIAAAIFVAAGLVGWAGPTIVGGGARPWSLADAPRILIVPALLLSLAALWGGEHGSRAAASRRSLGFWVGSLIIAAALIRTFWILAGLRPADAYELTIRSFACPAGIGMSAYGVSTGRPKECLPAGASDVTWTIEGGSLALPLTSADADVNGATTTWRGLPSGQYRVSVRAQSLASAYAFATVPSIDYRRAHASGDRIDVELGDDGSDVRGWSYHGFHASTVDALLISSVLDPRQRGEIAVTPHRCPSTVGLPDAKGAFDRASCHVDPGALKEAFIAVWPTREKRFDLGRAALIGSAYVWPDLPSGPYVLKAMAVSSPSTRYIIDGLPLTTGPISGGSLAIHNDNLDGYLLPPLDRERPRTDLDLYVFDSA